MEQESLTFEEAFAELESVVDKLEGGDLNLEDGQLITDESGKVAIQPFDPAESSE